MLSEYVFMPKGTKQLHYPKDFQWNATAPVYLVATAKNLGRWVHHFIKNAESIFAETNDPNLHVIIFDYNSPDISLEEVLKQSSLTNYMLLRQSGAYSRTRSFSEAINLVKDPQSIIFMMDLHLDIASPFINMIRKVSCLTSCYNNNNNNLLIGCSITRVVYIEVLLLDVYYMMQLKYKQFKLKSIYMIQLKYKKLKLKSRYKNNYNIHTARIKNK